MSTPSNILSRAQEIRDYLNQDFKHRAAHEGFEDHAWTAERGLAALLGEDPLLHAWIEPTAEDRLDREGTIHVLTAGHLLTAEYGRGKHGTALLESLNLTGLQLEMDWWQSHDGAEQEPSRLWLILRRSGGELTIEARIGPGAEGRLEHILGGIEYLKASMATSAT